MGWLLLLASGIDGDRKHDLIVVVVVPSATGPFFGSVELSRMGWLLLLASEIDGDRKHDLIVVVVRRPERHWTVLRIG